jgi:hypothetical protein
VDWIDLIHNKDWCQALEGYLKYNFISCSNKNESIKP